MTQKSPVLTESINQATSLLKNNVQLTQQLIQRAVEDAFASIEHVEKVQVKDCMTVQQGIYIQQAQMSKNGQHSVIRMRDLWSDEPLLRTHLETDESRFCEKGALLFNFQGPEHRLGIYQWQGPKAIFNNTLWRITPLESILPKFAYWAIKAQTAEYIAYASRTVVLKHIPKRSFLALELTIPDLPQQQQIVDKLDSIAEVVEQLQKANRDKLQQLNALKQP